MPNVTIAFGAMLCLLGVGMYLATGTYSWTALIPAFVGLPLLLLGLIARAKESLRKHAMHAAAAIGLLGFIAPVGRMASKGIAETAPAAVASQAIMAGLCLAFVVLCVRSFIEARRQRVSG
jgi:peptidoglycan/LPS O-acetylase OafA/YrhL